MVVGVLDRHHRDVQVLESVLGAHVHQVEFLVWVRLHPHVVIKTRNRLVGLEGLPFLFTVGVSEGHFYTVLDWLLKLLLDCHPHNGDHLRIMRVELELVIEDVTRSSHGCSIARKGFHFLLLVILPVRILTTAFVLLVFLAHGEGECFLELPVVAAPGYVGRVPLPLHLFLLVLLYPFGWVPLLVIVVALEGVFVGFGEHALN